MLSIYRRSVNGRSLPGGNSEGESPVVIVKLRSGKVVKFNGVNKRKERELVEKFILGSVSPKDVLDLKQHGKHRVADIIDMNFLDYDHDPKKELMLQKMEEQRPIVNHFTNCTFMGDGYISEILKKGIIK